jgi:glucose-1-phosphate thymidylyltransferase
MGIKCVIAAGGLGTRLQGFRDNDKTKVLLEVNSIPMINQQINQLNQWGVEENPKGISHAFSKAEQYIRTGDTVIFVLGDNFFEENLIKELDLNKFSDEGGCIIFTTKVTNPNEYGVASVDDLGNVIHIEEKPAQPKSNLAVVGLYIFDSLAMDNIKKLSPSSRGEYEITDLINIYINEKKCTNVEFGGWWVDAGTPDRIIELENLLA